MQVDDQLEEIAFPANYLLMMVKVFDEEEIQARQKLLKAQKYMKSPYLS